MTFVIDQPAHAKQRVSAQPAVHRSWITRTAVAITVVAGLGGLVLRLWWVFHQSSSADEDIVGVVAQAGLHGHFQAFLGGQPYGGTAEPYLIALAFLVFGQTAIVIELVASALAAVAAIIVWRIVRRLDPDPHVAWLAAALAWCGPAVTVHDSMTEYGFRGVALVCGLFVVLFSLRVLDRGPHVGDLAALGLMSGIGWWSTPEIAYFVVPVVLILGMSIHRSPAPRWRVWPLPLLACASCAVVGALPWIWANLGSRLASLKVYGVVPEPYTGRLLTFFCNVLPMEFGVIRTGDGARLFGAFEPFLHGLCLLVLGGALVLCVARGGPSRALAVGVVAFPFIYAISPFTWEWEDGRYGNYLTPLIAIVVAIAIKEGGRRLRLRPNTAVLALAGLVVLVFGLCVFGTSQSAAQAPTHLTSTWGDPDDGTIGLVNQLEHDGLRTGYADYWVAYKLDFYSRGALAITTAGYDVDRSSPIDEQVTRSAHPGWLFVPIDEATRDATQFSAPPLTVGPDGVTETVFKRTLQRLRIPYSTMNTPLLSAVIPARRLTPFEAGLPGTSPQ
jgi:Dolichyl-phosphate-mannose-protein mannosyltransferase